MGDEGPLKKPTTVLQDYCTSAAHILCVILVILLLIWVNTSEDLKGLGGLFTRDHAFSWHPFLMIMGMIVFNSQAILSYRAYPLGKPRNKMIHMILQTITVVFVCVALICIFVVKNEYGQANLDSTHSWLGIGTVCLFFQNHILGFVSFWLKLGSDDWRAKYLPSHALLGTLTFFASVMTVQTGITSQNDYFQCGYEVSDVDRNPAAHYLDIPFGCRVSYGMAITIFLLLLAVGGAVMNVGGATKSPPTADAETTPLVTYTH